MQANENKSFNYDQASFKETKVNAKTTEIFNIMSGKDSYYGKTRSGMLEGMLAWLNNAGFIIYADGYCAPESGVVPAISQALADYVFAKCEALHNSVDLKFYFV